VNQESEIRALKGSNPECPTGADLSVNLVHGLNPRQVTTTSAADAPPVSTTRERPARGIKILSVRLGYGVTALFFTLAKVVSNDSRFQGFLSMLFRSLIVSVGV
jgi:hypothetical protein